LRLFVYQSYTDELLFKGDWAFLRLFESAQINIQNRNSMIARWKRNIQNMIMLPYGVKVKFSETVFPFGEKEFFNINCPERIMERDAGMRRIVQNEID
jgi:type VI protein secretion system component VasK